METRSLLGIADVRINVIHGIFLACKGWRSGWERLCRPSFFPMHVTLRNRAPFNRPQRLASHAVENEQEALLRSLCDRIDCRTVPVDRHQLRSRCGVVVPEVMMHKLKVPQIFACSHVQRDEAIRKEILPLAICAIKVVGRSARGGVQDASFLIHRELAPDVRSSDIGPGIGRLSFITPFSGVRHGVEDPSKTARAHIVGTNISRGRSILLACSRANNKEILENTTWGEGLDKVNGLRIAAEILP